MALYGIGDLHLSLSAEKPMDIFEGWTDHMARLEKNWRKRVKPDDLVVLPGDLSWAMSLDDAKADFAFIDSLPGDKVLLKGNHDYWWSTVSKIESWLDRNGFHSISVLNNKSVMYKEDAIAGTRGWLLERTDEKSMKVYNRELNRLRLSLEDARRRDPPEILVFLHYPPIFSNYVQTEVLEILSEFCIKRCYYGHVHGKSVEYAVNKKVNGISFKLISADYLRFSPHLIR